MSADLSKLAEAATPGPWRCVLYPVSEFGMYAVLTADGDPIAVGLNEDDAGLRRRSPPGRCVSPSSSG